ncbi:MAG: DUF7344 domain-containing protein [Halobacteriota archaeon]
MQPDRSGDRRKTVERWDRVFKAFSAKPRRELLISLFDAPIDRPVALPEAAMDPNLQQEPYTVRIELYHHHLPMLAAYGFVRWDSDPLVAYRGPKFDDVGVVVKGIYENVQSIPDNLVTGCHRLEIERANR